MTRNEDPSQDVQEVVSRKVCVSCGRIHEGTEREPRDPSEGWKIIGLAAAGILLIGALWVWVFKFGVPLVKKLNQL